MKTSIKIFFQKHWQIKRAARHFEHANYGSVLKTVKKPLENPSPTSVFLNLFRLIALKETGREDWAEELALLNRAQWLENLNQDEKNYVLVYLLDRLFGEIDISPFITLKSVSQTLRETLPIDQSDPKFLRFFRKRRPQTRRAKPIQLHGFHARHLSIPTVIRFSGNYQNHKLFCLGKGSSFFS